MGRNLLYEIVSAMENGELHAFFQPQYNMQKAAIGGAEALVRWVKPNGTILSPAEYIPELEAAGEVGIVDWFMAEEACKMIKRLGDRAIRISVNFGREHAYDIDFTSKLNHLTDIYGIDKSLFVVEITESAVAINREIVTNWAKKIEKAGYTVAIDDFGSGMSSLSFVKDIPAQILKIDKSFLDDNCQSDRGRRTLESIFYFANRLKLITVVEGVETEEQLNFINTCDCDFIQGFIFSKPVSENDFYHMCVSEATLERGIPNMLYKTSKLSQMQILVDSLYKKYPFIVYVNLSKNSYQIVRRENLIDDKIPETGKYDAGYEYVKNLYPKEYHQSIEEAFLRENLLKAYRRGEQKVVRIINSIGEDGILYKNEIEDYFFENQSSKDVYLVSFLQNINYEASEYIDYTNVSSFKKSAIERKKYEKSSAFNIVE